MVAAICAKCNTAIVPDSPDSKSGHCPSCGLKVGVRHAATFPNCRRCASYGRYYGGGDETCRPGHAMTFDSTVWAAIEHGEVRCPHFEEAA